MHSITDWKYDWFFTIVILLWNIRKIIGMNQTVAKRTVRLEIHSAVLTRVEVLDNIHNYSMSLDKTSCRSSLQQMLNHT